MNKRWIYGVIAGVALFTTACATTKNAAPAPGTTVQKQAGTSPRALTNYDRTGTTAGTYGTSTVDGLGGTTAGTYGTRGVDGLRGTTGTFGTRGVDGLGGTAPGTAGTYGTNRVGSNNYGLDGRDGYYGTMNRHATYRGTGLGGYPGTSLNTGYNAATGTTYNPVDGTMGSIYRDRHMTTAGVNQPIPPIGFVKMDSTHVKGMTNAANRVYVDRNALAHAVGAVTASMPEVRSSTVLVTDEEVFVGLNTTGHDANAAKHKARMSAMSVSPRYYKVYVTDNQQMINEMTRVAHSSAGVKGAGTYSHYDQHVDNLVRSFGGTADGDEMRAKGSNMTTQMRGTAGTTGTTGTTGAGTTGAGTTGGSR